MSLHIIFTHVVSYKLAGRRHEVARTGSHFRQPQEEVMLALALDHFV